MMEFEGQNNDFGGTKSYNNIPLDQRLKGFGPPKFLWSPLPWEPWDLIYRTGIQPPVKGVEIRIGVNVMLRREE